MFRKILAVEILAIFFKWGILINFIQVVHQVDFTTLNGLGVQTYKTEVWAIFQKFQSLTRTLWLKGWSLSAEMPFSSILERTASKIPLLTANHFDNLPGY